MDWDPLDWDPVDLWSTERALSLNTLGTTTVPSFLALLDFGHHDRSAKLTNTTTVTGI